MASPRKYQQSLSPRFGAALEHLDDTDRESAAVVREYVAALRSEAAAYRREAHRLRCALTAAQRASIGGDR